MRKSFLQLLLPALGYTVMGNILALVMSMSLSVFANETPIIAVAVLFAAAIYLLLVGVPAYKDGQEYHMKQQKQRDAAPTEPSAGMSAASLRHAGIGAILFAVVSAPSVIFLLGRLDESAYRLLNGPVLPLTLFLSEHTDDGMVLLPFAPYVFIGFYALTIPACCISYTLGCGNRLSKGNIMYKQ
jgi:hypothetical protein